MAKRINGLLWRNYRFIAARGLSALGSQFLFFSVPLIIYQSTGSISKAGLGFAVEWGIGIFALPLAGAISDRVGGSRLYMLADLARMAVCVLAFILLTTSRIAPFYVVAISAGVISFFANQAFVALESTLPKYVSHEDIPKAQAALQGIDQTSQIAGPLVAALLVILVDKEFLFLIAGVMFFASFLNLFLTKKEQEVFAQDSSSNVVGDILQGWTIIRTEPTLGLLIAYAILINLAYCAVLATAAAITTGVYRMPETYYGVAISLAAICAIVVFALVPWLTRRYSMRLLGTSACLALVLAVATIGATTSFLWFVVGLCVMFGADGLTSIYLRTERLKVIPKEHLGKTLGVMILIIGSSFPAAGLIVSIFSELIGIRELLLVLAIICFIGNTIVLRQLGRIPSLAPISSAASKQVG